MDILKKNVNSIVIMAGIFLVQIWAIIRANFYYNDDLGRNIEGYAGNAYDSRYVADWFSVLINGNKHITDISPLTQIMACIFLAIAVVIIMLIFRNGRKLDFWCYACGILLMSPYFLENISYKIDSAFMGLSVCVSVLPFLWKDSKYKYIFSSVLGLMVMCMTYQASSGIYPMLVIMIALLEWNDGSYSVRKALLFVLGSAVIYIVTLGFFALFLMKPIEEGYIDNTMMSPNQFLGGLVNNYITFYRTSIGFFMKTWNILVGIMGIIFVILNVAYSNRNKLMSLAVTAASLLMMLLLAFGVYPLFSTTLIEPRSMYGISVFLLLVGSAIVMRDGLKPLFGKVVVFMLAWCLFAFSFTYGNALDQQMRYVDFRTREVIDDLVELDCFMTDSEKKIMITGDIGLCPAIDNYPYNYVLIKELVPVYLKGGTKEWNSVYFYKYFNLPNVKRVHALENTENYNLEHESAYHRILCHGDEILIELK